MIIMGPTRRGLFFIRAGYHWVNISTTYLGKETIRGIQHAAPGIDFILSHRSERSWFVCCGEAGKLCGWKK